jgi:hypothetical protein
MSKIIFWDGSNIVTENSNFEFHFSAFPLMIEFEVLPVSSESDTRRKSNMNLTCMYSKIEK